ncbi:tyrosine-type recombinase/integrase [uncultured Kiloniella sp.]|uniref:site-specific integrase n=1 Tax=uncultured Kiloniella sp. TaxID=1133091 RepID=UPI00262CE633|nr:tyrosine-type recombinase/integrase [uncultured Kiloniella sp.]
MDRVKVNYPGLTIERLPSGNQRLRVRVEGNKHKKIKLHIPLNHKDFNEHYRAARRGIETKPENKPEDKTLRHSVSWLTHKHIAFLEREVGAGQMSPLTLKKRKGFMARLRGECGEYSMEIPTSEIIKIRDKMVATPASADSMVEAIRGMYRWAVDVGIMTVNPAIGIGKIDRGKGGAIPWTVADLKEFKKKHPQGTTAHLYLTLLMFTGCRIGDATVLGRHNEFERHGVKGLGWQPKKKGSAYVEIPMLPPLINATREAKVQGTTYLLTDYGRPFSTADSLGQKMKKWCKEAGLPHLSSHGMRKAVGHLLAQEGCTQYEIMSIHGHTEAKTSEVYTKGVERWKLAANAMQRLKHMDW